jgi:hypothetical protein
MRNVTLFYKCGAIKDFFDKETEKRIRAEYSALKEKEILRNMMTDTDAAVAYAKRVEEIKAEVKVEIEKSLGKTVEVGFDPTLPPNGIVQNFNALLGISKQSEMQTVEQFRRVVQMFAGSLNDESALEVASIYDAWQIGKAYVAGEFVKYGTNGVGDAQLYKVVSAHTSQADWTPDATPALYTPIGLNEGGYPVWSKPTGAHDAYNKGDIVDYNGTLYKSTIDGNVWSPDEYPQGWEMVN